MKITSKGQVTVPRSIREQFGLLPNTDIDFQVIQGQVVLLKKKSEKARMDSWLKKAKGAAGKNLSTDQILSMTRDKHDPD